MRTLAAAACIAVSASAPSAQGFDPRANCGQILRDANAAEQTMIAAWTFGYLASASQTVRPVDANNNEVVLRNISNACAADPQASLLDVVSAAAPKPAAPKAARIQPGSEADARALLEAFVAPGADHRALTQAILPTQKHVQALYAEPLGSAIWADLSAALNPQVAFVPKPGQTEVLVVYATTRALLDGEPVLGEFPGGYKDVVQYFKVDVPIVRFKFVKPGETSGFAFDGLVYLGERWVVIPKPWRSLR